MTTYADGQRRALQDLAQLAAERPDLLVIPAPPQTADRGVVVPIRLTTSELEVAPGGLPLEEVEEFVVTIPPFFPHLPPTVTVAHTRFVGHPHVLVGTALCVYRDPAREWDPDLGIVGFLNRLWDWLADAAAGRFDASTALYHPVGGVLHHNPDTPTVVVRHPVPANLVNRGLLVADLQWRTAYRLDLIGWRSGRRHLVGFPASVTLLPGPLVFGAGHTLRELLAQIDRLGFPAVDQVVAHLYLTAHQSPPDGPLYLVVGARNATAALPQDHHLLVARLSDPSSAELRRVAADRVARFGSLAGFAFRDLPAQDDLQWCPVSDQRPGVATRRDDARPTSWYRGKRVELWGCGGIGSWLAELLVRAGVRHMTLRDPGVVAAGHLVRQNYTENDVGLGKAEATKRRLRAISDQVEVEARQENVIGLLAAGRLPACDLIIDATVNTAVARLLERLARQTPHRALAQVALDVATATLGLLATADPTWSGGPYDIERRSSPSILSAGELEHFHVLWEDLAAQEQVLPERGCSVPTFHGAATDVVAVAATALDVLARRLEAGLSGLDLFAVAHAALPPGANRHARINPPRLDDEALGAVAVRLHPSARRAILQLLQEDRPARVLLLGEYSAVATAVWIDDAITVPVTATVDEVRQVLAPFDEASRGITRYIGDAVLPTDAAGSEDADERRSVREAVAAVGGALLVEVRAQGGWLSLEATTFNT